MTPLPFPLGHGPLVGWRLDAASHAADWDSGEGAYRAGGRWNGKGVRAVYGSVDPAAAILEVAVHKGFAALDTVPHVLTSFEIIDPAAVTVIDPATLPNPNWLRPGIPSAGQQTFGDEMLAQHRVLLLPSAVSPQSWNWLFVAAHAAGTYRMLTQERFALDTRLSPPI
ncbi:MAG: hypothetical protein RLZZ501_1106 [Pseudomonadota bacterium]